MTSLKNHSDNIPLLNEADYMKGESCYILIHAKMRSIYKVLNHPDKWLKVLDQSDNINNSNNEISYLYELECSYIAGEIGVGLKIYGYYIKNGDIHMIMEIIDETEIDNDITDITDIPDYKTIFQNENMYNKLLKTVDILLDNGIVNPCIQPNNIIIKKDGSIKIFDYSKAYQIPKLSLSRAHTGIMLTLWAKKYDVCESVKADISKRLHFIIHTENFQ